MRFVYSVFFYLLIPFLLLRLLWRSIKNPDYRFRWLERLAIYQKSFPDTDIWFHAVSVGEAESLFPLIRQIQARNPELNLLVTTTTPTGSRRVQKTLKDSVTHVYLPYDLPDAVDRFLHAFKPDIAVIMETEIWPNLYAACGKRKIPLYLINARLSDNSSRNYRKVPALIVPTLEQIKLIATQSDEDKLRYIAIGANLDKVFTMGNIKFDTHVDKQLLEAGQTLRKKIFQDRFVWLLASTHEQEEALFFNTYQQLKNNIPELLLVIAPRHPERFKTVKKACEQANLKVATRTLNELCNHQTDVYLADTLGELKTLYAAADIAFVGGSMVASGGHNVLEASAIGTPVLFGPHMQHFKTIAKEILEHEAAIQCSNMNEVADAVNILYQDNSYRIKLTTNGKNFVLKNQGVTSKITELLLNEIK